MLRLCWHLLICFHRFLILLFYSDLFLFFFSRRYTLQLHTAADDSAPMDARRVAGIIREIITEYGLDGRILSVTSDNEVKCRAACEILGYPWLPCLAHTLNLVVSDVCVRTKAEGQQSTDMALLFHRVHKFVKKIRNTNRLGGMLAQYVEAVNHRDKALPKFQELPLKLKADVPTRWNSKYHSLVRLLTLEEPVRAMLVDLPDHPDPSMRQLLPPHIFIGPQHWPMLREAQKLFYPFERQTNFLSGGEHFLLFLSVCCFYYYCYFNYYFYYYHYYRLFLLLFYYCNYSLLL